MNEKQIKEIIKKEIKNILQEAKKGDAEKVRNIINGWYDYVFMNDDIREWEEEMEESDIEYIDKGEYKRIFELGSSWNYAGEILKLKRKSGEIKSSIDFYNRLNKLQRSFYAPILLYDKYKDWLIQAKADELCYDEGILERALRLRRQGKIYVIDKNEITPDNIGCYNGKSVLIDIGSQAIE